MLNKLVDGTARKSIGEAERVRAVHHHGRSAERDRTSPLFRSLALGAFSQPVFSKDRRNVIHMETVAHARSDDDGWTLRTVAGNHQFAVAVVVARHCVLQLPTGNDFATGSFQLDDFVPVLCLSAISVVHVALYLRMSVSGAPR